MREAYTLLGCRGCGSTIVAAALELTGFPWGYEEVDYDVDSPERDRLLELNPLGQVPTLILPDDEIMTESAAIILLLHDRAPHAELVPDAGAAMLPRFLRWLMFINCAIYPTFTYGDDPEKWLPKTRNPERLEETIGPHRQQLWLTFAAAASDAGPWFLGRTFSALDLYIAVMCNWRPGRRWFDRHCPQLVAIAERVEQLPELNALFHAHFDHVAPLE
ncbi:glutathione S-transferase family protein [Serratia sp. AKBS12]|uniref:glutathione S-transferase family protein n=1 Tax=Serratia sp. AKBS12 TaxID=2974597 RepID=UPI0021654294|nr:glutathione S-transferase family protein [Serratia sp. AKBS12]MCS3409480.1 glutathione S-transferase family protein [Serratia sp. AKBS12]HEI8865794.1 glutathione S-transferase family protein [Serratia odorifera]